MCGNVAAQCGILRHDLQRIFSHVLTAVTNHCLVFRLHTLHAKLESRKASEQSIAPRPASQSVPDTHSVLKTPTKPMRCQHISDLDMCIVCIVGLATVCHHGNRAQ